jgi:tripartite-type tricarboxylate transporter receptor subunit TctC
MTIGILARRAVAAVALSLSLVHPPAFAQTVPAGQTYPDRPVRMLVPLSAGSTVDVVARVMSVPLAKALGQPVVVENVPGAGGVTGTQQLVRAPKDGLTIGMTSSNHVINPSIYKSVPFDSIKDITPISVIGTVPLVLVTHPSIPAKNPQELIALAKAKPGTLNYGSAGNGSALHLAGVLFTTEAGVDVKHVPYKGTGPLANDLVGGQVEMGFLSVTAAMGHIKSGKLRAIGVSTPKRVAVLPDVPTLAESGLPNYSFDAWIALIGPAGLPQSIVTRLHSETQAVLAMKDVQAALGAQGVVVIGSAPDDAQRFFQTELAKHAKLVKQSGATVE